MQDSVGVQGSTTMSMTVRNEDAKTGLCPTMQATQTVDILPSQMVGGAGVRVIASAVVTSANALLNAHARITGE